jgi:hypothetical protein
MTRRGEEEKVESGNAEKLKWGGRKIFSHGDTAGTERGFKDSFPGVSASLRELLKNPSRFRGFAGGFCGAARPRNGATI